MLLLWFSGASSHALTLGQHVEFVREITFVKQHLACPQRARFSLRHQYSLLICIEIAK